MILFYVQGSVSTGYFSVILKPFFLKKLLFYHFPFSIMLKLVQQVEEV